MKLEFGQLGLRRPEDVRPSCFGLYRLARFAHGTLSHEDGVIQRRRDYVVGIAIG
jgi:hypothetical protein